MNLLLFFFCPERPGQQGKHKNHCVQKMQSSGVLRKKRYRGWETASKALTLQARGPEFDPQTSYKKVRHDSKHFLSQCWVAGDGQIHRAG